ncbi:MAG: DUF2857 family protein [Burkholderiaceae bacterium]|nr:DUF2857 domain-containing protein [Aquabacterium sp.]NUP86857.1 DUF2857 family protein [Burkholderiaceae bacterium]
MCQNAATLTAEAADRAILPAPDDQSFIRLVAMLLQTTYLDRNSTWRHTLRGLGWPEDLITEMQSMSIADLARVLGSSGGCVGVALDLRKTATLIHSFRALRREEAELEYMIANGASPELLRTLFPRVNKRAIGRVRRQIGRSFHTGRPPMPAPEAAAAIFSRWNDLSAREADLRARYRRLKSDFPDYSLASLHLALTSY